MSWGPIFAAVAGGILAMSGEFIGRLAANRQARRHREELIEDRRAAHELALQDEVQREIRQRSRLAAEHILETLLQNVVSLSDPPGARLEEGEIARRAVAILSTMYLESPHITDDVLRERLSLAHGALDLATTPGAGLGVEARVVIHNVRNNVVEWITAYLQGRPMPEPSASWQALLPRIYESRKSWSAKRLSDHGDVAYIPQLPQEMGDTDRCA